MKFNIKQIHRDIPRRSGCRTCGAAIETFMDLGYLPLAGAFLSSGDSTEFLYPMEACFCPTCTLVQIPNKIPKEDLFNENYHYFSSVTSTLKDHFDEYATFLRDLVKDHNNPAVIEFGCNDGVLLDKLMLKGVKARGIDASSNVAQAGKIRGLDITCGFFGPNTAKQMLDEGFRAAIVTGSNVFAHNDDVEEILKGVRIVLDPDGYFIVEVHYIADLIEGLQFDFFYHEHCNYYSLHSISYLLEKFGFQVVDVHHLELHGGSIRVVSKIQNSSNIVSPKVSEMLSREYDLGICSSSYYENFANHVNKAGEEFRSHLEKARAMGKRIFGYGASGRSVTMLNYLKITAEHIEFMIDDSPLRANHIMPGLHVPIHAKDLAKMAETDICVVTAWTYAREITRRESWYPVDGREFLIPLPKLEVIGT